MIESLSVTDFDAYLDSPYQCYVERILRRTSSDDAAHELDGGAFGTLAHELLEAFGRSDLAGSTSADDIADWFERELEQLAARRFGPEAAPAVALQLRQLGWRLRNFARWQAAEAARGWRIEHVEWKPPGGGVEVSLDGEVVTLRGRIDRIDVHAESGAWRLIDYKTSDAGDSPRTVHGGRGGVWKKLQLPLYLQLVEDRRRELGRALPELGFLVLPKDDRSRGAWKPADWTPQELAHAVRTAGEIVRRLRAGDVTALGAGTWLADDPSLRALSGLGLVGGPRTARLGALVPEDGAVDAARDDGPAEAAS